MKFEEYEDYIVNKISKSIKTKNKSLYNKVYYHMLKWYKKDIKARLLEQYNNKNDLGILNIIKQIDNICSLSDFEKLEQIVEIPESVKKIEKISNDIYNLSKEMALTKKILFTEKEYNEKVKIINDLEKEIPPIFLKKYEYLRSESLLDLDFLKKGESVEIYSFRLHNYLNNKNNSILN